MRPIILVPGMGGSILVKKGHESRKIFDKKVIHNRWLNIEPIIGVGIKKWQNDMHCEFINGQLSGFDNSIYPYDVGGLAGVCHIVPELNLLSKPIKNKVETLFNSSYYSFIAETLINNGFKERETLFGFPYDFRLMLNPTIRHKSFREWQLTIEDLSVAPVIVTHSLGGIITQWFLNSMGKTWCSKHVAHVVNINVPWGGIPSTIKSVVYGEHYIECLSAKFKQNVQKNSGIIMCLPNVLCYNAYETFIEHEDIPINIRSYTAFDNEAFKIYSKLYRPYLGFINTIKHNIPTTMIISDNGCNVPVKFKGEKAIEFENGDNVVPNKSLVTFEHLFTRNPVEKIVVKNSTHTGILKELEIVQIILQLC